MKIYNKLLVIKKDNFKNIIIFWFYYAKKLYSVIRILKIDFKNSILE